MQTAVPQYHEVRLTLTEVDNTIGEWIGGPDVVDVGETLRVMLGDYFYGEPPAPCGLFHTDQDRTIVFAPGRGHTLVGEELALAIQVMGEIFWGMADLITHKALQVTPTYTHRPSDCFYKFFPATRELVIYTPALVEVPRLGYVAMDGRAVMTACHETLPSYLKAVVPPSF